MKLNITYKKLKKEKSCQLPMFYGMTFFHFSVLLTGTSVPVLTQNFL